MKNNKEHLKLSNEESNKITTEALELAILDLLEKKSLDKISITELVKKAGVSRSAFYRNYETKDALLCSITKSTYDKVCEFVKSKDFRKNSTEIFHAFFRAIKENQKYFNLYLNSSLKFEHFVGEKINPSKTVKEHYEIVAKEGAFYSILVDWFNNGMKESEIEMAKICNKIFNVYDKEGINL